MRFPRFALVVLVSCLLLQSCNAPLSTATSGPVARQASLLVIGHRGASGTAPEHTFAAYDRALALGADYLEQDLQQTSDGVLVVLHDDTLDRTARGPAENCTGPVSSKTLAQIEICDVGSWFNMANPQYARAEYVGQRIPTLEAVLQRYGQRANYYIETKKPEAANQMEERLLALLDRYALRQAAATRWQVLIQSFSAASLQKIHALDPALPLVQLYPGGLTGQQIAAQLAPVRTYAVAIGPSQEAVDPALVTAAHAQCLQVHPYTINDEAEMRRLRDLGVDGFFTNFPERLNEVRATGASGAPGIGPTAAAALAVCRQGVPVSPPSAAIRSSTRQVQPKSRAPWPAPV